MKDGVGGSGWAGTEKHTRVPCASGGRTELQECVCVCMHACARACLSVSWIPETENPGLEQDLSQRTRPQVAPRGGGADCSQREDTTDEHAAYLVPCGFHDGTLNLCHFLWPQG